MQVSSDIYPEISRLQGDIIIPYHIEEVQVTDENGTRTEYRYFEHRVTDNRQELPDLNAQRDIVYSAVETALHNHVFALYPVPSQLSILSHSVRAQIDGRNDIVSACESVRTWCGECVVYFRTVIAATYTQDPLTVTWDFEVNCPLPEISVTLSDIEEMWS